MDAAARRQFRAKSAEQLKRAKSLEEAPVILSPDLQEELSSMELGKTQLAEAATVRAERDEKAEALKAELRALALNEKATDPKAVIELNAKSDGAFFPQAESLWEEAREAATKGLANISDASEFRARTNLREKSASKRLVEQGRMSAEDLATRYVMARARLKAGQDAGLDEKELAKLQDALDKEPTSYYLRVEQAKVPAANEDMEAAYLARRNQPTEPTPERKRSAKEQAAKAGAEIAKRGVRTRANKTAEAELAMREQEPPVPEEMTPITINIPDGEYQVLSERSPNITPSPSIEEKGPNTIPGVAPQGPQAPRNERSRKAEAKPEPVEKSLDERLAERDARRAKRAERRVGRPGGDLGDAEADIAITEGVVRREKENEILKEYATGQRALDEAGIALVDEYLGKSLSKDEMDAYSAMEKEGKLEDAKEYLNALARARAAEAAGMGGAYAKFLENYANSILDQRIKKQQGAGSQAPRGRAQNAPRAGKGGRQTPPRPQS